jgi:hypothetical protein
MAAAKSLSRAKPADKKAGDRKQPAHKAMQAKLEVGAANDRHEREADQVAKQVMNGGAAQMAIPPTITPLGAQCKKLQAPPSKEEKSENKPAAHAQRKAAPSATHTDDKKSGAKKSKAQRKAAPAATHTDDKKSGAKKGKAQRKAAPTATHTDDKKSSGKKSKAQRKASPAATRTDDKKSGGKKSKAQRKEAVGAGGGVAPGQVESSVSRMQGGAGSAMDSSARSFMEGGFGREFSSVRVHHDENAATAASALGARAFTVGNDIFFNRDEYRPNSAAGRELLAHELTHTVQQTGGASAPAARKLAQRAKGDAEKKKAADAAAKPTVTDPVKTDDDAAKVFKSKKLDGATVDLTPVQGLGGKMLPGTITLPKLGLPKVAGIAKGVSGDDAIAPAAAEGRAIPAVGKAAFTLDPVAKRDNKKASETWTSAASAEHAATAKKKLQERVDRADKNAKNVDAKPVRLHLGGDAYFFKLAGSNDKSGTVLFGTLDDLAKSDVVTRPQWAKAGNDKVTKQHRFDADHFLELQLGGLDGYANMWLLDSDFNQHVGNDINTKINNDLQKVIDDIGLEKTIPDNKKPKDSVGVRRTWRIIFSEVAEDTSSTTQYFWKRKHLADGAHIDLLDPMTEQDMTHFGLKPDGKAVPSVVHIFATKNGGARKTVNVSDKGVVITKNQTEGDFLFRGVNVIGGLYHAENAKSGSGPILTLDVVWEQAKSKGKGKGKEIVAKKMGKIDVDSIPGLGITGFLSRQAFNKDFKQLEFIPLCPLTISDIGVNADGVLTASGMVKSELDLLPGLPVPVSIYGDRIGLDFPIPDTGLKFGPFEVSQCALGLTVGEMGFGIEGSAHVAVQGLAEGDIRGIIGTEGVLLSGSFDLATDFLSPAHVNVVYNVTEDELSAKATLGLAKDKCPPGIASATGTVEATKQGIDLSATLGLAAPLTGAEVQVSYSKEKGLHVGAENIPLPLSNVPAVKDAKMSVAGDRDAKTGDWRFSGSGSATVAVPAVTGHLDVSYVDGLFTIHGVGQVEKGPASGTLDLSVTNGTVDPTGAVTGPPTDRLTPWGHGSVSVKFGILIGTAGVTLTPENNVIIDGKIAMPPTYPVFDRKEYNKEILHISPPEFPIWGVSVAGIGVGVFAFVDAGISFHAFVGPGEIRNAEIDATMDLDKPEDAKLHGHGEFFVPAFAGLDLDVGGGLRARAAIAFAEGRVGLTGELGVAADASAKLDVDWSRATGLSLDTKLAAHVQPKFKLSANARIKVGVDLGITDVSHTFGPWEKPLGEFGPNLELGVEAPVRWTEAQGLDFDLDKVTITKPNFDAPALMSSVFDALAG